MLDDKSKVRWSYSKPLVDIEAEFGEIILVLDEVYSEMHKFKFMGFKIESKKSIRVLGTLVDVLDSLI